MLDKANEDILVRLIRDLESVEHRFKEDINRGFNIFAAAGLVRQEIRHSTILAYLLNPAESHGLGDRLAKHIINYVTQKSSHAATPNALKVALADFDDLIVDTEVGYNKKRIDILAYSIRNEVVLVIENKVDSGEGDNQLKIYSEKISRDTNFYKYKKLFVYLTLDGDDPSESEEWVGLGYKNLLDILSDILVKEDIYINDEKRIFINHYIELVRKHIMEEINQDLREACIEIYRRHKTAIDLINNNLPTPVSDAQQMFYRERENQITKFHSNKRSFGFLPNTIFNIVPETAGTDWFNQKRPLVIWFAFWDNKIGIIIEVGPMANSVERTRLVQELEKLLLGKSRDKAGGTYSRVWSYYKKVELEKMNHDDVKDIMDELYTKLESENLLDHIKNAVLNANLSHD